VEELIVYVLQFILEFLFEVLANLPFELPRRRNGSSYTVAAQCFWLFLLGAAVAWVSLWIHRHTVFTFPSLRIANVILAPIVSGYISRAYNRLRTLRNDAVPLQDRFWQGFSFTLGLVLIRFAYATRA
jgi:hypothetical protein